MASVAPEELAAMGKQGRERLGNVIGREQGKTHVSPPVLAHPLPLAAIYYLVRHEDIKRLEIAERPDPEPALLLASTFLAYLRTTEHLIAHLETCSQIAESVRIFEVRMPAEVPAREVAESLERQLASVT
jgi:hypothetical protein